MVPHVWLFHNLVHGLYSTMCEVAEFVVSLHFLLCFFSSYFCFCNVHCHSGANEQRWAGKVSCTGWPYNFCASIFSWWSVSLLENGLALGFFIQVIAQSTNEVQLLGFASTTLSKVTNFMTCCTHLVVCRAVLGWGPYIPGKMLICLVVLCAVGNRQRLSPLVTGLCLNSSSRPSLMSQMSVQTMDASNWYFVFFLRSATKRSAFLLNAILS